MKTNNKNKKIITDKNKKKLINKNNIPINKTNTELYYFNNYLDNFVSVKILNDKWNNLFNFFILYFENYHYSRLIINIIKTIHLNKFFVLAVFLLSSWYWSNLILKIICNFMLVDSIIISLLVLQNNSVIYNSRRLCKNIILYSMGLFNLIGGMINLLMIIFIYLEYSKFINRLVFKIIKFIIKIIGGFFPPIYLLYPDIKLFNFDDPDITIRYEKNYDSNYNSNYDSDYSSNLSISSTSESSKSYNFKYINKNKIKNNDKSKSYDEYDLSILKKFGL